MIIRKIEALFTLNVNRSHFKEAFSGLNQLNDKAQTVMNAIAGYWAVTSLHNFVSGMAQIGKTATYLGVTTDALQELRYAADKSGVSIDGLEDGLKELQIRAGDALAGSGDAFEAFRKVGVKPTDALGHIREPLELLTEVADKLKDLPTQADRLRVADAMFGDEGSKMLIMLQNGSQGLKKLREEAKVMGRVLGRESVDQAERLTKSLHRLKSASLSSAQSMSVWSFTPLAKVSDGLSSLMENLNKFEFSKSTSEMVKTGFLGSLALAAAKATQALIPLWPAIKKITMATGKMALRGTGIGGILLLLHDVWSMFNGANSVAGGLSAGIDKNLNQAIKGIVAFAEAASSALSKGFSQAFTSINKEFAQFSDWLTHGLAQLVNKANEFIAGLVPDFFKGGFLAKVQHILPMEGSHYGPHQFNARLAPSVTSVAHQQRLTTNQNVNVAVNVKSGADPHEIGGEVSKAVRKELERERFNAFMGVTQYAG